jgi:hypothetical protein
MTSVADRFKHQGECGDFSIGGAQVKRLRPFDHDELRTHVTMHGVEISQEAFHGGARGMGHSFYVHDPFGNKIEIKGPAEYPDGRMKG